MSGVCSLLFGASSKGRPRYFSFPALCCPAAKSFRRAADGASIILLRFFAAVNRQILRNGGGSFAAGRAGHDKRRFSALLGLRPESAGGTRQPFGWQFFTGAVLRSGRRLCPKKPEDPARNTNGCAPEQNVNRALELSRSRDVQHAGRFTHSINLQ